jgi:hypothetical protein
VRGGPHRIDVIGHRFRSPEVKDLPIMLCEDMHHRQLHVVTVPVALVVDRDFSGFLTPCCCDARSVLSRATLG